MKTGRLGLFLASVTAVIGCICLSLSISPPPDGAIGASTGSFVAGTPVLTSAGPVPIESVRPGTTVLSCDPAGAGWTTAVVQDSLVRHAAADIVAIQAGTDRIEATGDHVFWALKTQGSSSEAQWVAARSLTKGCALLARDGKGKEVTAVSMRSENREVFDLTVEGTHAFSVGTQGILAGDSSRASGAPAAEGFGEGGCFPAGTPVLTKNGILAIERVTAGTEVWSFDMGTGAWTLDRVEGATVQSYEGDLITIGIGGTTVTTTGNHPFRVLRGQGLAERPPAADVPPAERNIGKVGRWVEARRLMAGDVLESRERGQSSVESLHVSAARMTVYNLKVSSTHTYAILSSGILVHNKGRAEGAPSTAPEAEGTRGAAPDTATRAAPSTVPRQAPPASGLRAGYADDNEQFNYFIGFLKDKGGGVPHVEMKVDERIVVGAHDRKGKSLPDCLVSVSSGGALLCEGRTHADGTFLFFPSEYASSIGEYAVSVRHGRQTKNLTVPRSGKRSVDAVFDADRPRVQSVPLDVLFVLDTTGSMGEEIQRLKATIEIIDLNLTSLAAHPRVRFGMVLFRDRGDVYDTKTVALTDDLPAFRRALNEVSAGGGGDGPEDLQAALNSAMRRIDWSPEGIRLAFVITDAPPHLDYGQQYTYANAAREARTKGIKIHTVGCGGLDLAGEYVMRQISQYTGGRYIFLTYGEQGESEGGESGSVSHHTGANWQADRLETIIIRFAKEELQYLSDEPVEEEPEYFEARKVSGEPREETLAKLFGAAAQQLLDFSGKKINAGTPTAVLPLQPAASALSLQAEYFTEQLIFSMGKGESLRATFRMVERKDLQQILREMEIQQSGLVDDAKAARVGEFLGAELLVTGTLYRKDNAYELFMKLIRVQTAEILSVTKAMVDTRLAP